MRAILSKEPGGPDSLVLEDVPVPSPGPGSVLVAVKAVGVNFPDLLIIEDRYQFKPQRPFAPGLEVSGVVEALGEGVTGLKPGDRILAMVGSGGMVEKMIIDAARCVRIPDSMPFDEAAAFLLTYGTSLHALEHRGRLAAGDTLLVLGAAGGVGLAAVEIGKAMGARVVAAVSSEDKLAAARAAGADDGLVYPTGALDGAAQKQLSQRFKELCAPHGPNVIYDPVGGDYAEPALRAIAWEGRYLVVGFPAGIPKLPFNLPLLKGCDVCGVFWGAAVERDQAGFRAGVAKLFEMYARGAVKPRIHAKYPLEQAADALKAIAARGVAGKIVVEIG